MVLISLLNTQFELLSLPDNWMISHEQYGGMLFMLSIVSQNSDFYEFMTFYITRNAPTSSRNFRLEEPGPSQVCNSEWLPPLSTYLSERCALRCSFASQSVFDVIKKSHRQYCAVPTCVHVAFVLSCTYCHQAEERGLLGLVGWVDLRKQLTGTIWPEGLQPGLSWK